MNQRTIPSYQQLIKGVFGSSYIPDTSYVCPPIYTKSCQDYFPSVGVVVQRQQGKRVQPKIYRGYSENFPQTSPRFPVPLSLFPMPQSIPPPHALPTPPAMTPTPAKLPRRCPYCGIISIIKWRKDDKSESDGCRDCYLKVINQQYKIKKRKIKKNIKKLELNEVVVIEVNSNSE